MQFCTGTECVPSQVQSAKTHHLPWCPLPLPGSGGVCTPEGSIPPALLTVSTSTERVAPSAQVSKNYTSGPKAVMVTLTNYEDGASFVNFFFSHKKLGAPQNWERCFPDHVFSPFVVHKLLALCKAVVLLFADMYKRGMYITEFFYDFCHCSL